MSEINVDAWPNCSTPDCEFKSCLSEGSDKCYGCLMGTPRQTMEQYMQTPALEEDEWKARHEQLLKAKQARAPRPEGE